MMGYRPLWCVLGCVLLASCAGGRLRGPVTTPEGTTFHLRAPEAKTVAVVGGFNHWDRQHHQLAQTGEDGVWSVHIPLPAGRHPYLFLVDAVTLVRDPTETASAEDPFGRKTSLLVVPPPGHPVRFEPRSWEAIETALLPLDEEIRQDLVRTGRQAVASGVPPPTVKSILSHGTTAGLSGHVAKAYLDLATSLSREGVLTSAVSDILEQGALQQQSVQEIGRYLEPTLTTLRTASMVVGAAMKRLGQAGSEEEYASAFRAATEALRLRIDPDAILPLIPHTNSLGQFTMAVEALIQLKTLGMPGYLGHRVVAAALTRQYGPDEFHHLRETVVRGKRRRVAIERIGEVLESGLIAGRDLDQLGREIERLPKGQGGGVTGLAF